MRRIHIGVGEGVIDVAKLVHVRAHGLGERLAELGTGAVQGKVELEIVANGGMRGTESVLGSHGIDDILTRQAVGEGRIGVIGGGIPEIVGEE